MGLLVCVCVGGGGAYHSESVTYLQMSSKYFNLSKIQYYRLYALFNFQSCHLIVG